MLTEKELLYIEETAHAMKNWTVSQRRALHRIPETGWNEKRTTACLKDCLIKLGYSVSSGEAVAGHETGLIAELENAARPVIALRFDIDALPVDESCEPDHLPFTEGFGSLHPGTMHACGHDGHMAIGLSVARFFSENRQLLSGKLRFIFQPAEEGCRGAGIVVEKGWLKDADYFLAGHIVGREYGKTTSGYADCVTGVCGSLATTKINTSIQGSSCHGACPENGASAISALCAAVLSLNGIPRNSGGATMINVGTIRGGEGRNIVAASASMELEVRGETTELNTYMEESALSIIEAAANMYHCTARSRIVGKAPSLATSPELHQELNRLLRKMPAIRISEQPERFRASEDAAYMMEDVKSHGGKAAFLLFPCKTTAPLHSFNYDFDEDILSKAVTVFCTAAASFMSKDRSL